MLFRISSAGENVRANSSSSSDGWSSTRRKQELWSTSCALSKASLNSTRIDFWDGASKNWRKESCRLPLYRSYLNSGNGEPSSLISKRLRWTASRSLLKGAKILTDLRTPPSWRSWALFYEKSSPLLKERFWNAGLLFPISTLKPELGNVWMSLRN